MRLGILADIHEAVGFLRGALAALDRIGVEQLVFLGDVCEMGGGLEETISILAGRDILGVWGNHDIGLSFQPDEEVSRRYPPRVMEFMQSLLPRVSIEDCSFTHVEPWLNPCDVADIWYFDGIPDTAEKVRRSFNACRERVMLCGSERRL